MDLYPDAKALFTIGRAQTQIKEGSKLVKQAPINFRLELELQIKQELWKFLDIGFIKSIQHLPNIVLVKKKNEQIR